jgi:hypothetical protein
MWADDATVTCHVLVQGRVAQYRYDVQRFDPSADGEFYKVVLTSLEHCRRDIYLTVFWDAVRKTYEDGRLAEAITLNIDDALRHFRGRLAAA